MSSGLVLGLSLSSLPPSRSGAASEPGLRSTAAVEDAKRNAQRNGVTNASFVAGKAEDKINSVLRSLTREEKEHVVAVVDPPRAGLHDSVLKALRACMT